MASIGEALARLAQSKFRASFGLTAAEREYVTARKAYASRSKANARRTVFFRLRNHKNASLRLFHTAVPRASAFGKFGAGPWKQVA